MNNRILIIAIVLVCVILFSACFAFATKTDDVNPDEDTSFEDFVISDANLNQAESINTTHDLIGFDLQADELFFILNNSLLDVDVTELLGEPEKKSDPVIWVLDVAALEYQRWFYNSRSSLDPVSWGGDKVEYQTWYYYSKGIEVGFISYDENQQIAYSIDFISPCNLKTIRGIGIGSTKSEVLKAYEHEINPDVNISGSESIVVGTVYKGLIFIIEHDVVSSIFIGVVPEREVN